MSPSSAPKRPLIGCGTYRKTTAQTPVSDIVGLMPSYIEAVVAAGGIPILLPLTLSDEALPAVFARIDGLLIPGGGDIDPILYNGQHHDKAWGIDKQRDAFEFSMVRAAVAQQKPMLAICRGHQVFNVALGGTLWEDVGSLMPAAIKHDYFSKYPRNHPAHRVEVKPDTKVAHCLGQHNVSVNSLHHQGIRDLAPECVATAVAPDGLIEAIELPGHPFAIGVQWHPENLIHDDPAMLRLFKGLVEAAGINTQ